MLARGLHQLGPQGVEVGAGNQHLVADDRVVGDAVDPLDVAAGRGDRLGHGVERRCRQLGAEDSHHGALPWLRWRRVGQQLEIEVELLLPTEQK